MQGLQCITLFRQKLLNSVGVKYGSTFIQSCKAIIQACLVELKHKSLGDAWQLCRLGIRSTKGASVWLQVNVK